MADLKVLNFTHISTELTRQFIVNKEARKARHQKVFAGTSVLSFFSITRRIFSASPAKTSRAKSIFSPYFHPHTKTKDLASPSQKLFKQYTAVIALLFAVGSFTPLYASNDAFSSSSLENFVEMEPEAVHSPYLADDDGYFTKVNPQTLSADRSTLNDYLVHTVSGGETLSAIAATYGLKANTILWANGMTNANSLRTGQELLIPPGDGVYHKVSKNETLDKIAKAYSISIEEIMKKNGLADNTIAANQDIFIPGGKPIVVETPRVVANRNNTPSRVTSSTRVDAVTATSGGAVLEGAENVMPAEGKIFIFPTDGKITRGYIKGHYALDIGNRAQPAVWAAGGGTVVKVHEGCGWISYGCGGGYGNHIIIDHGNGFQTLYAHLNYVSVQKGDYVGQGQTLGQMGRSGNSYGATGIHLHFEVRKGSQKLAPQHYY